MGNDHHFVGYDQANLCLLLITDMMALSSPSRLNTSSLQTLSHQVMFKTFLQSHISQLSSLHTSSFFKVHDWALYRRVLKMTFFISLFFRQRLKAFVSSSFLLVKAFTGYFRCNFRSFSQDPSCVAPKVVKVRFLI